MLSCANISQEAIISKIEKEYHQEFGDDLVMHREWEEYNGTNVYRFTGLSKEYDDSYMINSAEWVIIFYKDNNYQVIKQTAYMPMDSIVKINDIKYFTERELKMTIE